MTSWNRSELGRPVQLVHLDEEGDLILDKEALILCLEQGGVKDAPVCLVSVIGKQRQGKSFLLNCLLRRLRSPEATDGSWLGREDEVLGGFECRAGMVTVTKGVWMWGQPFWVQAKGRKVAVFLVDTEGCLDLQRDMETSIKLSVFSILLSSYWIFNISSMFTRTEADYLEMFVQVAKEVGKTCNLSPIQPLDLLVRDWHLSEAYGLDGGKEYLETITRDLATSDGQPLVLGALTASGTRCYLLPHPGKGFIKNRGGTPHNMDEDFRHWLSNYVTTVVHSAGTHVRTDQAGQPLTGTQLAERIKVGEWGLLGGPGWETTKGTAWRGQGDVSRCLKTKRWDFSSPMKMAETLAEIREEENRRAVEAATREYEQFVQELDHGHQDVSTCLRVTPEEMQGYLDWKRPELLQRCRGELRGDDPHRQAALQELQQMLAGQAAQFLVIYRQRYEMIEQENRRAVEATKRDYEQFVQELDRGHQDMMHCLWVSPAKMQERLEGKCWELLQLCQGELRGDDPHRQAALQELKQVLAGQTARFLATYRQRYEEKAEELGLTVGGVVGAGVGAISRG
ncbi:RING finger protein 112-like [Emydura macquarii macquarii]|uniref:RING finger protein 112-like n=1 Tax=Emydura macquarii macquarii TaxID=1129001 RepID=UPI00352B97B7